MGGYKRTKDTVYAVYWPENRVMKVGYSAKQRWRKFLLRNAVLLGLKEFDKGSEALDFEGACHEALAAACRPAFRRSADASRYLGTDGAGYLECYCVPADLMAGEVLDFLDHLLDQFHAQVSRELDAQAHAQASARITTREQYTKRDGTGLTKR